MMKAFIMVLLVLSLALVGCVDQPEEPPPTTPPPVITPPPEPETGDVLEDAVLDELERELDAALENMSDEDLEDNIPL